MFMKKKNVLQQILLFFGIAIFANGLFAQSVGIGTITPDSSAALDITSPNNNKGLLIPRITLLDVGDQFTIEKPANSLIVYNTGAILSQGIYYNQGNENKANWIKLIDQLDQALPQQMWGLNGNDNIDPTKFIGTVNNQNIVFKQNSEEVVQFYPGGAVVFTGNPVKGVIPPNVKGPGARVMWMPGQAAFRAGKVGGEQWDEMNIGNGSFATGLNTVALGDNAIAMGNATNAVGNNSIATGCLSSAFGTYSTAMGMQTTARAYGSFAAGVLNSVPLFPPDPTAPMPSDRIFEIGNGKDQNNRTNALTVLRNGMIGIGTTGSNTPEPGSKLHIFGNANQIGPNDWSEFITLEGPNATSKAAIRTYNTMNNKAMQFKVFDPGYGFDFINENNTKIVRISSTGNMTITGIYSPSDTRLKTAIEPLGNILNKINNIQPISYYFKDKEAHPAAHQVGFSAQEIEKEFPELVVKNEDGYLAVNYPQMTAVAIQAVKEQQELIHQLQQTINHQDNINKNLQAQIKELQELIKK